MADFVNNIEFLQYKAPTDLPDVNSQYVNSAEEVNTCITQQIKNTIKLSGVELPSQSTRSDAIDPLFLAKTIQHYASFAQTYIVDVSSTENNIIITPSVNDIQLQTVLLESNGSEIVATTNNIDGLVDAQVFDELPNGAIFQFIPLLSNTSSNINLTVRIKRLKWDIATLSQIVENKDFSYPIKDIDGITNLSANEIIGNKLIIVHFDSNNNVFKVVNKTIIASQTTAGISYLPKTIILSNNISNPNTQLNYSSGSFIFDDFSGSGFINAGSVNITTFYPTPANNTGYYLFAVYNPTTSASQVIISNNKTTPTLPAGFTKKKYIGALMTNGTGQIRAGTYLFKPDGTYHFTYDSWIEDAFHQNNTGAFQNYTITIPNITGLAYISGRVTNDVTSAYPFIFFYQANKLNNPIVRVSSADTGESASQGYVPVLGNSQIAKQWGGNTARRVWQYTLGWVDYVI